MKKLTTSFAKYINAFKIRSRRLLTQEQKEILEESSIEEAERVLEELEREEDQARSKMLSELKSVFFELPSNL
ncbi:hypothetical protein [Tenacibaculum sp. M341]|uniref:hypothetical protein n=1 Tax=Tenacibaculum sp. M341 TaxID=2530339 RepID=UPI001050353C|nr:hypothetical protein [Tenacibaculum sp. M341]TCI84926.1 hypothetical protein EYW44_18800 [Tenacibaculum sp. M341]